MFLKTSVLLSFVALCSGAALDPRIVDGEDARPGQIPYIVSLQSKDSAHHFCGGVILNAHYVITAAHCLQNRKDVENILVISGTTNLENPQFIHNVEKAMMHEDYDRDDSWRSDIGLIKVIEPFVVSDLVGFVPMPAENEVVKGNSPARVSGFGRLWHDGPRTKQLHYVDITVADQEYCKKMYKRDDRIIKDSQLCANDPSAEKGHCKGDSGGPLMVDGKLAGLVSWSKSCANTKYPSVYTRVTSFVDWIEKHAV